MTKSARNYTDTEIWLEQQMKCFWEGTRGSPVSLGPFLRFWVHESRLGTVRTATFSDDWLQVLYTRVSYLLRNRTLLGTEEDKVHQARVILATASLLRQGEVSDIAEFVRNHDESRELAEFELANFEAKFPVFFKGFESLESKAAMEAHVLSSGYDVVERDPSIDLIVINGNDGSRDELHTYPETTLREFIDFYRSMRHTPAKSFFRIKYRGRILFLSNSGNSTLAELSLEHRSFITVFEVQPQPVQPPLKKDVRPNRSNPPKKRGGKKRGGKKSKGRSGSRGYETKNHREEHSKKMSLVFEEAEGAFKDIRRRLSDLSIRRSPPKDRSVVPRDEYAGKVEGGSRPSSEEGGGKAGRVAFRILVGDEEQLYRSSKRRVSERITHAPRLDLHGCREDEALGKLDEAMPLWVEAAMTRERAPFVVAVEIVCGGGGQVLSEAVEGWIRRNPQVANRRQSY